MNLSERDAQHNWHPYTQHKTAQAAIAIVRGEGALLWDENGKSYIDAIASWWVNPYGHANPVIAKAIYMQLTTLEHVLFGGFTHPSAVELTEKLLEILPSNQNRIFYSDNGSTAVEVAIKVAVQFYYNKGQRRTKIIAFENAFHGDTFGAMAASGISFFTEAFKGNLIDVVRIPVPVIGQEEVAMLALENILQDDAFAAFIFEPLVQGAAGMVMYEPSILNKMIEKCHQKGVFAIADEVMTGFGKTGKTFASDYLSTPPDMICLSKALTAGAIPMAVTSFTENIFQGFYSDDINHAFFHGHTFTANPTGCAAALAGLKLLQSDEIQKNIQNIHNHHLLFKARIQKHSKVQTVRVLGVIMALEVVTNSVESYYGNLRNRLYHFFIEQGIILRPVGNIIYVLPPYIITEDQLNYIYETIEKALEIV